MQPKRVEGCLFIEDFSNGPGMLSGPCASLEAAGVRTAVFTPGPEGLHLSLQRAYQRLRGPDGSGGVVAVGSACACALALSAQLPVDRQVLIDPWRGGPLPWALRRVRAYARRNAVFCLADTLIVDPPGADPRLTERLAGDLCNSRVWALRAGEDLWSNRKEVLNSWILQFLCDGEWPKSLAENSEMCIIYG